MHAHLYVTNIIYLAFFDRIFQTCYVDVYRIVLAILKQLFLIQLRYINMNATALWLCVY
jgi:hypothetical protein